MRGFPQPYDHVRAFVLGLVMAIVLLLLLWAPGHAADLPCFPPDKVYADIETAEAHLAVSAKIAGFPAGIYVAPGGRFVIYLAPPDAHGICVVLTGEGWERNGLQTPDAADQGNEGN